MEPSELQEKRIQVGLVAVVLLLLAAGTFWYAPEKQAVYAAMLRVGLLMGAFWLAIPVIVRHPKILKRLPWYLLGGIVLFVSFASRFWMLIPLFILLAILTMFSGKRPDKRR